MIFWYNDLKRCGRNLRGTARQQRQKEVDEYAGVKADFDEGFR